MKRLTTLVIFSAIAGAQQYTISTVAGNGRLQFSGAGGPAVNAHLISPLFVAIDSSGNVFASDTYYQQVFKISPAGIISVYAGTGVAGFSGDGGVATQAQLQTPTGLAVDSSGNLYIADSGNARVRIVTPQGTISTYVSLTGVYGITLDPTGNLYATSGNQVFLITPKLAVSTIAGAGPAGFSGDGGPALSAQLYAPAGLKVDALGNVFVADTSNQRVREITPQGIITTVAGNGQLDLSGDNGPATKASVYQPFDVAVDPSGDLYISEASNFRIRVVVKGIISEIAGGGASFADGPATQAALISPAGIVLDGKGNLIVAVSGTRQVRTISAAGSITTIAGVSPTVSFGEDVPATSAPLLGPWGIALDASGNLYISDNNDSRVRQVNTQGLVTTVTGNGVFGNLGDNGPASAAELGSPQALAFDATGNLFISSGDAQTVREIQKNGTIVTYAGGNTGGFSGDNGPAIKAQLFKPWGLATDAAGNLYIADSGNNRIRRVDTSGTITTYAGTGTAGFSGDNGPALQAELFSPLQLAFDAKGNLYISDSGNYRVRMITPAGVITTVAGNGAAGGAGDGGSALNAQLEPWGIAVDSSANLYIANPERIRKVDVTTRIITTIAGTGALGFSGDNGPATSAEMSGVTYLALDASGNLYVTDAGNLRIRKLAITPVVQSVQNGATFQTGAVSPGEIISVFGSSLGPSTPVGVQLTASGRVSTQAGGTQVLFDGIPAPLLYVSSAQLNVVVPYEVSGSTVMQVSYQGNPSTTTTLAVTASSPGIFGIANQDDSVLVIYGTGEGQTNPPGVDGNVNNSVFPAPVLPVSVKIGGQPATVLYAGAAPGFVAGVLQVNVQIPSGLTGTVPVQLTIGSASSQPGLTVTLH